MWEDHVSKVESLPSSLLGRDYLLSCLEKVLLSEGGCFERRSPLKETISACMYVRTITGEMIPCVEAVRKEAKKRVRRRRSCFYSKREEKVDVTPVAEMRNMACIHIQSMFPRMLTPKTCTK